jgi:hypothetical protein
MGNPKDFYNEINQERRCQVGLHNFPTYDSEDELLVCKRCKYMQLPYERIEVTDKEKQFVDTFKKIHFGQET